jgi:hypothetical protein
MAQTIGSKPASNSLAQSIQTITNENIEIIPERSNTVKGNSLSGFPYNGKVNTTSELIPRFENPSSELSSQMGLSEITENNLESSEELESTSEEITTSYHIDWSKVPNLFTPNNDGQNDFFSPFEGMPEWLGKGWMISYEGNVVKTCAATEQWDGNNNSGFEMPAGNYIVEVVYVAEPQSHQILKRMMVVKLVR